MSALDNLTSIDAALAAARTGFAQEKQELEQKIFALETELVLHKDLTARASLDRDRWMRICTAYTEQFSLVEKVFANVKASALATSIETPPPPKVAEPGPETLSETSIIPSAAPSSQT